MAVSASKIKEIQTKLDKGATLQSLYSKGYAKSAIVAACKGKAASIIKKELANPKNGNYNTLVSTFGESTVKKNISTDTNSCVKLIKSGAKVKNLKSLGFNENTIVKAINKIKPNSSVKDKMVYAIKLNGSKGSDSLKNACMKNIKGAKENTWKLAMSIAAPSKTPKPKSDPPKEELEDEDAAGDTNDIAIEEREIESPIEANKILRLKDIYEGVSIFYNSGSAKKEETNLNHAISSNMMRYATHEQWDSKFNRMQFPDPYMGVSTTREYLFFTKPDLNIVNSATKGLRKELKHSSFWREMYTRYRRIISDLQVSARRSGGKYKGTYYADHDKHVFIPLLTNAVNSQLDLPATTADVSETAQTIYGTSIQYRKSSTKSDEGYDFSLDFIDAPWLDVYHFFKMWDEYETLKDVGYIGPPQYDAEGKDEKKTTGYYRINKILHDQIAIYKFVVDGNDLETILFYAKLIGCFPKSVPRDSWSSFKGEGNISYSVDWHAQFVEDMNPNILYEFNELCCSYFGGPPTNRKYVPPYSTAYSEVNGGFRTHPYIEKTYSGDPNSVKYLLRWYD